jgi:hypothetical protein
MSRISPTSAVSSWQNKPQTSGCSAPRSSPHGGAARLLFSCRGSCRGRSHPASSGDGAPRTSTGAVPRRASLGSGVVWSALVAGRPQITQIELALMNAARRSRQVAEAYWTWWLVVSERGPYGLATWALDLVSGRTRPGLVAAALGKGRWRSCLACRVRARVESCP